INDAASGQQKVRLDVFNILGQQVNVLVDEYLEPGPHTVIWDGTNETGEAVATGVYLYRLQVDKEYKTKKMLLLK
ncbi:FlgD immunoglobulin-like domain containing protein, partial [Pseudoalteromonas sp.]|uniref:FlgD immunoglobulin-like domain containing protein n=1 Tax=Pseudoalteromonas sp. TaxID=53249 RepID=UPI00262F77E4